MGALTRFFFARESPRPLALMRIGLGLILFVESVDHWRYAVELYSSAGHPMPTFPDAWEPAPLSPAAAVVLQSLLCFAALAVALGWQTRFSLLTAAILATWLGLLDTPGTYKKWSVIELHLLVLLACGRAGGRWSVDAFVNGGNSERLNPSSPEFLASPAWPRRLMQVLVCSIYFQAAITKIRLPDYATGDLLGFSLLEDLWGGKDAGVWLAGQRDLLAWASLGTVLFEFLFPFLVWVDRLRRPMLVLALMFHLTLLVTMHLGMFSPVMLIALLSFLDDRDFDALYSWLAGDGWHALEGYAEGRGGNGSKRSGHALRRLRACHPTASIVLYLAAGGAVSAAGLFLQQHFDWYGAFNHHPLAMNREISSDGRALLEAGQLPAYSDYVHHIELGSRVSNGRAFGPHDRFRRGMTVHALARLIRNRPNLSIAWILISPQGREVARSAGALGPTAAYATGGFEMIADAPAGRYRILLQLDGVDAGEKRFELLDDPPSGDSPHD